MATVKLRVGDRFIITKEWSSYICKKGDMHEITKIDDYIHTNGSGLTDVLHSAYTLKKHFRPVSPKYL